MQFIVVRKIHIFLSTLYHRSIEPLFEKELSESFFYTIFDFWFKIWIDFSWRGKAQHHNVPFVRWCGSEFPVGSMDPIQYSQSSETFVESKEKKNAITTCFKKIL